MTATLAEHDHGGRPRRRDRLLHVGILVYPGVDPSPQAADNSPGPMTPNKIRVARQAIEDDLLAV